MNSRFKRIIDIWLFLTTSLFNSYVEVVYSKCESYKSVKGIIVDETEHMLIIKTEQNKVVKLPKKGQILRVTLPDKSKVLVDGKLLLGTPSQRLKKKIKLW